MIARENKQILDYIVKGATHEQIMKWVGLSEKNYWKRIAAIRKMDMELTKSRTNAGGTVGVVDKLERCPRYLNLLRYACPLT